MKIAFSFFCLTFALISVLPAEERFKPLFDGKTLSGWQGDQKTFRVEPEQNAIVAGRLDAKIPRNEFLTTAKEYGDFELRFSARLDESQKGNNAGVQFRSQRIANHHEMIGYQCDIGHTRERTIWGSLYDESRRRIFLAQGDPDAIDKVVKRGGWNDFVVRCQGPRIQIWVAGLQTVDYTEKDAEIPQTGYIGLQIHSGAPSEAWYRNIRIKPLGQDDE